MSKPKRIPSNFDLNEFATELASETDRGCAVLGAALLDAALKDVFRNTLLAYKDKLVDDSGAPLATFSARIKAARALGWINDEIRQDLDLIRGIRNDFAHDFDHTLSFDDASTADRCREIKTAQAFIEGLERVKPQALAKFSDQVLSGITAKFSGPRWRYQVAIECLLYYLRDLSPTVQETPGPDLFEEIRAAGASLVLRGVAGHFSVGRLTPSSSPPDSSTPSN
jgi:DNA-binding MltR family transcriptional regulator